MQSDVFSFLNTQHFESLYRLSDEYVNEAKEYYLCNGTGNVTQTTAQNGSMFLRYTYDPFGNVESINAPMVVDIDDLNRYTYNGEDYDFNTGLQYLRARYYSTSTGNFISQDTYLGQIINPISRNRYTYAHNSPVVFDDPSGHYSTNPRSPEYKVGNIEVTPYSNNPRSNAYNSGDDNTNSHKSSVFDKITDAIDNSILNSCKFNYLRYNNSCEEKDDSYPETNSAFVMLFDNTLFGHSGALIMNEGEWYYVYWGSKYAGTSSSSICIVGIPDEGKYVFHHIEDPSDISDIIDSDNESVNLLNLEEYTKENVNYTSQFDKAIYFSGNYYESFVYFEKFEDNHEKYNLYSYNCADVVLDGLLAGELTDEQRIILQTARDDTITPEAAANAAEIAKVLENKQ